MVTISTSCQTSSVEVIKSGLLQLLSWTLKSWVWKSTSREPAALTQSQIYLRYLNSFHNAYIYIYLYYITLYIIYIILRVIYYISYIIYIYYIIYHISYIIFICTYHLSLRRLATRSPIFQWQPLWFPWSPLGNPPGSSSCTHKHGHVMVTYGDNMWKMIYGCV